MARKRNPKSKNSFGGLRLKPSEELELQSYLKDNERSLAQLLRFLVRDWLKKEHGRPVVKLKSA